MCLLAVLVHTACKMKVRKKDGVANAIPVFQAANWLFDLARDVHVLTIDNF